jgi:preprotein translocase subunit SecE
MAKNEAVGSFWTALVTPTLYKRTQGKRVRQTTAALIAIWSAFGCWTLSTGPLMDYPRNIRVGIPTAIGLLIAWLSFRLVNIPQFADFLIAVEAEMRKVSWPTMQECLRAAAVVIATMFMLAMVLFAYDQFWMRFFSWIGVLRV